MVWYTVDTGDAAVQYGTFETIEEAWALAYTVSHRHDTLTIRRESPTTSVRLFTIVVHEGHHAVPV